MKNHFILTVLLSVFCFFAHTQIIHVPDDYATIQMAVDAATQSDTILVSQGTYVENVQINKALTIASNYLFSADPSDIENTIIDGNQMGSVFTVEEIQNDTVRFIGLTVTNGNGTLCDPQGFGYEALHGGGFYIKDVELIVHDNMIIRENQILTEHNSAGGVFCQNSSLWIRNSTVKDNLVRGGSFLGEGAGLYFYESEVRITDCEISGNSSFVAYGEGGGIYAKNSALEIFNSTITNNECIDGGAIHLIDSDAEIHACNINSNLAHSTGAVNYMDFTGDHFFLMTNTTVNENDGTNGLGAIRIYNAIADIYNCQFNNNVGGQSGGAFACSGSEINIYNTEINNNQASTGIGTDGGGMVLYMCTVYLNNVEFKNNVLSPPNSFNQGGAIDMSNTNLVMDSVVISNNIADQGGAIYSGSSNIRMNHCLIHGHNAQKGGAIYSWGSHYEIISSTISDNTAVFGGGIHTENNSFVFVNSILWENTPSEIYFHQYGEVDTCYVDFAYSDVRGHELNFTNMNYANIVWHEGNLNADPMFMDTSNGDFNLADGSPLVDAGTAFFELDGVPVVDYTPEEYVGPAPDIGAFEKQYIHVGLNETAAAKVNVWPNPFTDFITINTDDEAILEYDLLDAGSKTLKHGIVQSGANLNLSNYLPGIYFLRIQSAEQLSITKIVKIGQ